MDPLLRPQSIAVIGASAREHSVGQRLMRQLLDGGYGGAIYPINPRYDEVEGVACFGDLHDLPGAVDLAVLSVFALPPFDAAWARRLVDRLALRALLDGVRGAPAADVDGLCLAAARLSAPAAALGDSIAEIDINPLIVGPNGCMAVDALAVPAGGETSHG